MSWPENVRRWDCPDCGGHGVDYDHDVYGPMSVPWGFLL
jgi:hypothetical protein